MGGLTRMFSEFAVYAEGLTKLYGRQAGCQDVTLAVSPGQVFGFLGPNGAGKSTFVKVLAGLHAPTAGFAYLFGHPAGSLAAGRLLGFVPELFGVPTWPNATELLRYYGSVSEVPAGDLSRRIDEVLERVGLPLPVKQKRVGEYSKGMRQRLCIAAALLHRPRLLLLDEPTSALDPVGRREVRDLIVSLRSEGVTVFLNSHLLSEVEQVADQVAIISAGRIVMAGTPDQLLAGSCTVTLRADPVTPALELRLAQLGRVTRDPGGRLLLQLNHPDGLRQVAAAVHAAGATLLELTPQRHTLEELFMDVVLAKEANPGA